MPNLPELKRVLKHQLLVHEGVRLRSYLDTTGHKTVGIGFNLERDDAQRVFEEVGIAGFHAVKQGQKKLTLEEANRLLDYDLDRIFDEAKLSEVNWEELSLPRKAVVADMIFNLGYHGFLKFKNTRRLIRDGRYKEAGRAMMHSRWAGQVKSRATHLVAMMQDNEDFNTVIEKLHG